MFFRIYMLERKLKCTYQPINIHMYVKAKFVKYGELERKMQSLT